MQDCVESPTLEFKSTSEAALYDDFTPLAVRGVHAKWRFSVACFRTVCVHMMKLLEHQRFSIYSAYSSRHLWCAVAQPAANTWARFP